MKHSCANILYSICADDDDKDAEDEDELPTTKIEFVKESAWKQLNTQNAIWLREPREISATDYENFYQAISKVAFVAFLAR